MNWIALHYIRTHLYLITAIADAVGGSSRSAVNLKQCSRRDLNEEKEHGLIMVCTFIVLEQLSRQCRCNKTRIIYSYIATCLMYHPLIDVMTHSVWHRCVNANVQCFYLCHSHVRSSRSGVTRCCESCGTVSCDCYIAAPRVVLVVVGSSPSTG